MYDWIWYYLGFGLFISLIYMDECLKRPTKWHVIIGCVIWPMLLAIWVEQMMREDA